MKSLVFIPIPMRVPLKFGAETIHELQLAHVEWTAYGAVGRGETPLSVAWAWPSQRLSYAYREQIMRCFCEYLAERLDEPSCDPIAYGCQFLHGGLEKMRMAFNARHHADMPYLAALIAFASFDIAIHDAWGIAHNRSVYELYNAQFLEHDLACFFQHDSFRGLYPQDFFVDTVPDTLLVWHLVGGKDFLLEQEAVKADVPKDDYPVSLEKWLERDGLKCLKIKLTGTDAAWDYERLVAVGKVAQAYQCEALSADFNCLVQSSAYVNDILDMLKSREPAIYELLLYVEQPFPEDLEANRMDVTSCSARKPLFLDESAHDWRFVELGRSLGWNGVALKVCKTQTGALLSGCWAKQHGMSLMVQDLTNPRLAIIPHVLLAAYFGTIKGVECNAAQFYPAASLADEQRHPGLYERRNGVVRLSSIKGAGFGYE